MIFAWANGATGDDDAKRGIILGAMNTFSIAVYMFWSILFYSTTQGPDWKEGSIAMICMGLALIITTIGVRYMEKRDKQRMEVQGGVQANGTDEVKATIDADSQRH